MVFSDFWVRFYSPKLFGEVLFPKFLGEVLFSQKVLGEVLKRRQFWVAKFVSKKSWVRLVKTLEVSG